MALFVFSSYRSQYISLLKCDAFTKVWSWKQAVASTVSHESGVKQSLKKKTRLRSLRRLRSIQIVCYSERLFVSLCCTSLCLIFVFLLPPQIAALQKGGDSFPLTVTSGKVLGKVRQRTRHTHTHETENQILVSKRAALPLASENSPRARGQTRQNPLDDINQCV